MIIKYSHSTNGNVKEFFFDIYIDENTDTITMHTYRDLSGFELEYGVKDPAHFCAIGACIQMNMGYIKRMIHSHMK